MAPITPPDRLPSPPMTPMTNTSMLSSGAKLAAV